jgi:hypothetical protein
MRRLPLIAACSAVGLLVLASQAAAQSREFSCGEDYVVKLKVIDKKTISAGPIAGRTLALMQVPGKTMVYANGKTSLEIGSDQKRIAVRVVGEEPLVCVFPATEGTAERSADTDAGQPAGEKPVAIKPVVKNPTTATADPASKGFAAKSWGGVVRSGPGMEFKQVASLKEGENITVIEDAGVEMNGYRWYKIRFGGNRTGFQWGGILCPIGKTVAGAFQSC